MTAYYNEHDPFSAQWLRNLIAAGHLPAGDVDERDIQEVKADDVKGYTQAHFFAGIGGWALAGRLAGWPDDRPMWTGSCPCQPFSSNGARKGEADPRHLWPYFRQLIAECDPAIVFGEQVASSDGRKWFSRVCSDLETLGYAVGAADLCAAGVGSPQQRQRLWFVADSRPSDTVSRVRETKRTRSDERALEASYWSAYKWIESIDGRVFRNKPGLSLLAHGFPGRVGRLRAYGNAIVPQVAAAFIGAVA